MNRNYISGIVTGILMAVSLLLGFMLARVDTDNFGQETTPTPPIIATIEASPTETFPPSSPLPSITPSQTLRPPPTFEPPTATLPPSQTPTITPSATLRFDVPPPEGLQGLPSPTSVEDTEAVCEKREDWALRYTVQAGDALANIAQRYSTFVSELVFGNCMTDANTIIVGQVLRVPGDVQPNIPQYICTDWEALTPFDGAFTIDPDENLTFNWRGTTSERYLVRVVMPSGAVWEELVDLKQNLTIYLPNTLPEAGNHTWYVYPLGLDFAQIPCLEGGPWNFHKEQSIALTWTPTSTPTITDTPEVWEQTATAKAQGG
jgi:LysM repeat protein